MGAAVEEAAGGALADAVEIGFVIAVAVVSGEILATLHPAFAEPCCRFDGATLPFDILAGRPFAPLFEKKWHSCRLALIADRAGPVRVHGPRAGTAFAASDDPVEMSKTGLVG